MKRTPKFAAALAGAGLLAASAVTGCGSGQPTLSGTYNYNELSALSGFFGGPYMDCAEHPGRVQVAVDGLVIGSTRIHWGKLHNHPGLGCSIDGTWSMSVPQASKVFEITVPGESGTVRVTPANESKSIHLSNG